MTDGNVTREWIVHAGESLYDAVIQYRDHARQFCIACLGMRWDLVKRDNTYFAEAMRKAREEKKKRLERLRALIPKRQCCEPLVAEHDDPVEADGFLSTLLGETRGLPCEMLALFQSWVRRPGFDLKEAQEHILMNIGDQPVDIKRLPPIVDDARLDLVSKFVAAVFLQQSGLVCIEQRTPDTVFVSRPVPMERPAQTGQPTCSGKMMQVHTNPAG
jgi:hypothetical protein